MNKIISFIKSETVLFVSLILAIISAFFVPPGKGYIDYIDLRTLGLLFSLMTITEALKKSGIFEIAAQFLLSKTKNNFQLAAVLVFICFFSGMIITNDVALITFVPLAITVLKGQKRKLLIPVVVLQTIAANTGSMFTPIGNPQNLYLYGISNMSLGKFIGLMLPYTITAAVLLIVFISLICKNKKSNGAISQDKTVSEISDTSHIKYDKKIIIKNALLFILCLLTVSRIIDWKITCCTVFIVTLATDRKLLKKVDYSLLLTFCGFFIFTGNIGSTELFSSFMKTIINGREIFVSTAVSQIISNVPCALLLSGFTDNIKALLIGTNIGGLGTLIASMASLISYKIIAKSVPEEKKNFLKHFTISNSIFLVVMIIVTFLVF